jgi:hypothetical protein
MLVIMAGRYDNFARRLPLPRRIPAISSVSRPAPEDYVHLVMNEKPDWVAELICVEPSGEPESFPDQKGNRETRHLRV